MIPSQRNPVATATIKKGGRSSGGGHSFSDRPTSSSSMPLPWYLSPAIVLLAMVSVSLGCLVVVIVGAGGLGLWGIDGKTGSAAGGGVGGIPQGRSRGIEELEEMMGASRGGDSQLATTEMFFTEAGGARRKGGAATTTTTIMSTAKGVQQHVDMAGGHGAAAEVNAKASTPLSSSSGTAEDEETGSGGGEGNDDSSSSSGGAGTSRKGSTTPQRGAGKGDDTEVALPSKSLVTVSSSSSSSSSSAQLDLFPSFGYDKTVTEVVRVNNFRDGVYYDVPVSREALRRSTDAAAEAGGNSGSSSSEPSPYLSHYSAHGLPYKGEEFISSNDWRGKCFYEAHNFCVLNGTLTFFHPKSANPAVMGGSLRMCTEFSQHSPTIRLKYESRPLPEDGVLPAPLMTKTPAWIVQYWCQDLFHMTLTMLPAYQTKVKEFPRLLERAGILNKNVSSGGAEGEGEGESSKKQRWAPAAGGGHNGAGPIPSWWRAPATAAEGGDAIIKNNMSQHYALNDGDDVVHPDIFVRIAKGKRKKSAHCRVKLGDPRNWEDVRNSKWNDKQFPIAGNPYWPFYQTLTSQPDRIYPLYRGATAKSACYTNGIVDKYYIKGMLGEEAREYTAALNTALSIPQGPRRRCGGRYRVTLIDRRGRTRRLTNIPEIAAAAEAKGFAVQTVALETLPIRKQLELISSTDVLMGMHGNGITWLQFLPPGSAVVELVGVWYTPYALLWGHKHFHSSMKNNMPYKQGGEFKPFAHNVSEIELLLEKARSYLDTTSCAAGGGGGGGGDGQTIDFKPPNERLENLYKDCVPHC